MQVLTRAEDVETPMDREAVAAQLFEAFNRRDLQATLALAHPEIVFSPVSAAVMSGGEPYRGHAGLRQYMADVDAHFLELTVHAVHIRAAGAAVVALGQVKGRGPAGVMDEVATNWVLKFKDGLVARVDVFSDGSAMREAFGLESSS